MASGDTLMTAPDLGIIGGSATFGSDRPGERKLYDAMISPINRAAGVNLGVAQDLYGSRQAGAGYDTSYFNELLPALQDAFGLNADTRNQYLSTYQQAMQPHRAEQMNQLSNVMAAQGLGGGRGARALAQQQRGFAQDDLATMLQLLNADISGRQQAASSATGLTGQRRSEDAALLDQALQSFTGLSSEASKAPVYAMEAFKPAAA